MKPWTEWIINVKIPFTSESNKLPMICLSERLVVWIRKTPGSRGALSPPPWVIESCTILTLWWLREHEPDWSPESGSLRSVAGPHSNHILCDLCHRAESWLITVFTWTSRCWELLWSDCTVFLYHFIFPPLMSSSVTFTFIFWLLEKVKSDFQKTPLFTFYLNMLLPTDIFAAWFISFWQVMMPCFHRKFHTFIHIHCVYPFSCGWMISFLICLCFPKMYRKSFSL